MKKTSWKTETWVGIFLLAGIVMLVGAVISIGDFKSDSDKSYPIAIMYKNADGLIKGSQLKLGGAIIGVVTSNPELTDRGDAVILHARIDKDVRIQVGSRFNIEMQGVMGAKFIDVEPPSIPSADYVRPGEFIIGESESDLVKIKNNAKTASEEIVSLLRKLDQNSQYIEQAIKDISKASRNLSETADKLNSGVLSEENMKHFGNILSQIDKTTAETPQLIAEARETVVTFRSTALEANRLIKNAQAKIDKLDPVFQEVPLVAKSLKSTSDNLSSVVSDVKKGNGTLGLFLYDRKFRNDFEDFVRNLRDYGILRYRDPKEAPPSIDPRSGYSGSRR